MVVAIVYCLALGSALAYAGFWLMTLADRRSLSFSWMTVMVIAAAVCFLAAVVFLSTGTYSLAEWLWNIGR